MKKKSDKQVQAMNPELEQTVAQYLQTHADFFERHLQLLESLRIPHRRKPAISLIERQVLLLREQNVQLRQKLQELVQVARDNDCLSQRMQHLNLALIEARTLDDMLHNIQNILREEFSADFAVLRLAVSASVTPDVLPAQNRLSTQDKEAFGALFQGGRPRCGALDMAQAHALFADAALQIASSALVPLHGGDWCGVLAIGSRDSKRFHPGMGILFLSRIGELISHALHAHLYSRLSATS